MEGTTAMAYVNDSYARDVRAKLGDPGNDPISRLRHVVKAFAECSTDEEWVIRATGNIYGDGVTTGLTWGDLRAILAMVDKATPAAEQPKTHTMGMPGAFSEAIAELMDNENEPQEVRDAYHKGRIERRGRGFTRIITAPAVVLQVFSEYADSIAHFRDDTNSSQRWAAARWLKDMHNKGL